MSATQFRALTRWMENPTVRMQPKFVLTSSIVLPRRLSSAEGTQGSGALHSDSWDGYPRSLHALLKHVCDKQVDRLVFLSGDEHVGCDATITVRRRRDGRSARFRSVHCPALYAPYPFANSIPADFKFPDKFDFDDAESGDSYRCTVEAEFHGASDGFAIVSARDDGSLRVSFR